MQQWYVYIVRCADRSLYTGIATDVVRRIEEHNHHNKLAARYTRARRPVKLVYCEACDARETALRRELQLKRLTKSAKEALVGAWRGCSDLGK